MREGDWPMKKSRLEEACPGGGDGALSDPGQGRRKRNSYNSGTENPMPR